MVTMTYTPKVWLETGMDAPGQSTNRVAALNNLETQYDTSVSYYITMMHDANYYQKDHDAATYYGPGNQGTGSGFIAYTIGGKTYAEMTAIVTPPGSIALWSGTIASIPAGWALCNGAASTPNLTDRFLVGSGPTDPTYYQGSHSATIYTNVTPTASIWIAGCALPSSCIPDHAHSVQEVTNAAVNVRHEITLYSYFPPGGSNEHTDYTGSGTAHDHNSGSYVVLNAIDVRPAYYALAYIIKL
jgi:hypothetical protein